MVKVKLVVSIDEGELQSLQESLPFTEGVEINAGETEVELTLSMERQNVEIIESTLKDKGFDIINSEELPDGKNGSNIDQAIHQQMGNLLSDDDDEDEDDNNEDNDDDDENENENENESHPPQINSNKQANEQNENLAQKHPQQINNDMNRPNEITKALKSGSSSFYPPGHPGFEDEVELQNLNNSQNGSQQANSQGSNRLPPNQYPVGGPQDQMYSPQYGRAGMYPGVPPPHGQPGMYPAPHGGQYPPQQPQMPHEQRSLSHSSGQNQGGQEGNNSQSPSVEAPQQPSSAYRAGPGGQPLPGYPGPPPVDQYGRPIYPPQMPQGGPVPPVQFDQYGRPIPPPEKVSYHYHSQQANQNVIYPHHQDDTIDRKPGFYPQFKKIHKRAIARQKLKERKMSQMKNPKTGNQGGQPQIMPGQYPQHPPQGMMYPGMPPQGGAPPMMYPGQQPPPGGMMYPGQPPMMYGGYPGPHPGQHPGQHGGHPGQHPGQHSGQHHGQGEMN